MSKLIELNLNYNIKVSSRINNYLNPDYIYLPITFNSTVYKKSMEEVLKGEKVLDKTYSSVSGLITGGKKINNENYIIITNNFKEKNNHRVINNSKKIKSIDEFKNLLQKFDIDEEIIISKDYLLIDIIEEEPYILNKITHFKNNISEYLELLDYIKNLYKFNGVIILTKNTETSLLNILNNKIGTYPDFITVTLPNLYLINEVENYKKYLPCDEIDTCKISYDYLQSIYYALYKNSPITEKYITITGDAIKNPIIVNTKIGTRLSEIIDELIEFKDKDKIDVVYYLNSIINKKICLPNQIVVDKSTNGIIITYDHLIKSEKCIKCGLCQTYCPLGLNPIEKMNKDGYLNCSNCQICSFVCPSHIGFKYGKEEDNNEL